MARASTIYSVILIAATMTLLITPGIAHEDLGGLLGGLGGALGGLGGLGGLGNDQCLSSIIGVNGCVQEVIMSALSFQFGLIGPACCQAVVDIDDNCWPKVLPLSPLLPLKNYCIRLVPRLPIPSRAK